MKSRIINRVLSCVMAVVMSALAAGGLDIAAVEVMASSEYTLDIVQADSLEDGKNYIFLDSSKDYAMGVEQGVTNPWREAVEVKYSDTSVSFSGETAEDIIWSCRLGSDGKIKLYSQKLLEEGRNAYLGYSLNETKTESGVGGEQHEYDAANHLLYAYYSTTNYYVQYSEEYGGFCKRTEAQSYYDTCIYAYEVISCNHTAYEPIVHAAKDAACTTAGSIAYYECGNCHKLFTDSSMTEEILEADTVLPALGHDWDEGVVEIEPTATKDGRLKRTCRHDPSHVKYESIPMTGGVSSEFVNIKSSKVTSLVDGKQYIIMSYPSGGQALSSQVRSVYEGSGSYNYLSMTPVSIDESAGTATFNSAELAQLCVFTAEENPNAAGQFRFKNDDAYIYKYYSMIEMREDAALASWFTYSTSGGLKHVNSELVSSYPNVAVSGNVYKGVTGTGGTSPVNIYEAVLELDEYTVSFESNGGSRVDSQTVAREGSVSRPEDPVREGYDFGGWYTDEGLTVLYDFALPVTANITLYAAWNVAEGESETVYVKRVKAFAPGNEYIIVAAGRDLAMSCDRGNEYYNNSRGGNSITFAEPEDGKLTITFKNLEEKHEAVWTSTSQSGAGEVTLSINGSLLGTKYYASHFPAEENESGYTDNVYFYIDGDYLKTADTKDSFMYDSGTWKGFRPYTGGSAIYVYQIVNDDYAHTEHTLVKTEEVPATCLASGTKSYYTCTVCGELFADAEAKVKISAPEVIPALGHDYGDWTELNGTQHQRVCSHDSSHIEKALHSWDDGVVTQEATSDEEGVITYTCKDCGAVRYEAIAVTTGDCPESGTVGYIVEAEPAQTLEDGVKYIILSKDGTKAMTSGNIVTPYGGFRLTPADVTLESDSGRIVFSTSTDAMASIWTCDAGAALKQDVGSLYAYMSYLWCGTYDMYVNGGDSLFEYNASTGKLYAIGAESYAVGYDSDYKAFCTVPGNSCVVYKVTNIVGLIADNSHNLVRTAAKDPTCTAQGNIEYYKCSKCGKYFTDAEGKHEITVSDTVVAALGHDMLHHEAVAAACEEQGADEYYECVRCGLFFADSEGKSQIAEGSWITEPIGHDYDDGVITTEPTCTEAGVKTYTCRHDSAHTRTETVEALDHDWFKKASYQASCTEDGYDLYECRRCGETEKRNIKKATGHTPGEPVTENVIEAQPGKDGSYDTVIYCSVCHEEISRETTVVPAAGYHIYVEDYTRGEDEGLEDLVTDIDPELTYSGEVTFTVTFDKACVVAVRQEDGTYVRLYGKEAGGAYAFTVNVTSDVYIAVAIKGDADLGGTVKSKDATIIVKYKQLTYDLSPLQMLTADVDGDGTIKSKDATIIVKHISGTYDIQWDIE